MTKRVVFFIFILFVIFSCTSEKRVNLAKEKITNYYTWLGSGQIDSLSILFGVNKSVKDSLIFVDDIKKQIDQLGDVISFEFYGSTQESKYHSDDGKSFSVTVKYKVKYSRGGDYDEQFQFITNKNHTDSLIHITITDENNVED